MASKPCATCSKLVYPTEKVSISDLWVHRAGCLKCSECFSTLSLSSAYVAPSPLPPHDRLLFCAKDVPRMVHTSVVDSMALQAALKAPKSTSVPAGQFAPKNGKSDKGRSMRFKGLTLRSKGIRADAPKLDVKGQMHTRLIVGNVSGSALDSWDIAHALSVQAQVSSPIRDHPAVFAQRTGTAADQWPMPSQPIEPQYTGNKDDVVRATKGDDIVIEEDLVKNLIKVFQLETIDRVELTHSSFHDTFSFPSSPSSEDEYFSTSAFSTIKPAKPPVMTIIDNQRDSRSAGDIPVLSFGASGGGLNIRTITTLASRRIKENKRAPLSEIFLNPSLTPQGQPIPAAPIQTDQGSPQDVAKAMKLLQELLPLAAHLIPLPSDAEGDVDLIERGLEEKDGIDDPDLLQAREELVRGLRGHGLEMVMLFEEEPSPSLKPAIEWI